MYVYTDWANLGDWVNLEFVYADWSNLEYAYADWAILVHVYADWANLGDWSNLEPERSTVRNTSWICKVLWNRDENSSCNIFKVAENAINKKKRPTYLCRVKEKDKLLSPTTSVRTKSKITRG